MWCQKNHILDILKKLGQSILTWTRGLNHDHEGGSSRARLLHCTKEWLTPAISPNVGNSTSSFLLVGICVRANPFNLTVPCTTEDVQACIFTFELNMYSNTRWRCQSILLSLLSLLSGREAANSVFPVLFLQDICRNLFQRVADDNLSSTCP